MNSFYTIFVAILAITLVNRTYSSESDSTNNSCVFEIYITKDSFACDPTVDYGAINLDTIELNDTPFLTVNDIEYYDTINHIIHLSKNRESLNIPYYPPVNGQMFIVVANGEPIYCGFLWAGYSSTSCNWVVIKTGKFPEDLIEIELGYPSEFDFHGTDPRDNPIILDALNKNGLLTGIPEWRPKMVNIYPNPTNGILNVSGLNSAKNFSVSVYNEFGKLKYKSALAGSQIDFSNQPIGIYFIQLYEDKKLSGTYKIIKTVN